MTIVLNQKSLKIVIFFEWSGITETQVTDFLLNTIWPNILATITTGMNNNFDPGWTVQKTLKVKDQGNNLWEIYPKFAISGTTNLTKSQLRTGISNWLKDLKPQLITDLQSQGATNITFHLHYEDGRTPEADEN